MISPIQIWKDSLAIVKKNPRILAPFIAAAAAEGLALYILFLTPQRPVAVLLAPPVRAFFGEKFLHYPHNLLLLPRLFYYARLCLGASMGILMTGTALGMIKDAKERKSPRFLISFVASLRRCLSLLAVWIVMLGVSFLTKKGIEAIGTGIGQPIIISTLTYTAAIVSQMLFIYAMPAVIIEKKNFLAAIKQGVLFTKKHLLLTLLLLCLPMACYVPMAVLNNSIPALTKIFSPEAIVAVLGTGVCVTLIMDILTTIPPTMLFLKKRG